MKMSFKIAPHGNACEVTADSCEASADGVRLKNVRSFKIECAAGEITKATVVLFAPPCEVEDVDGTLIVEFNGKEYQLVEVTKGLAPT